MELFQSGYVFDLIKDLLEKSKSIILDEVAQAWMFDSEQEMETLHKKLLTAQALLDGYQPTDNAAWQQWAGEVTEACYDIEDLAEDMKLSGVKTSVFGLIWTGVKTFSVAKKVQDLQTKLESTTRSLEMIMRTRQQQEVQHVARDLGYSCLMMQHELAPAKQMFGRVQEKENVVSMLLTNSSASCSVSIVGMGGLGKTTLARNVLKDSQVQARFKHIFWVTVAANFDLAEVSEKILHQMLFREPSDKKMKLEYRSECQFYVSFHDLLQGKSALIVLDDLLDVNYEDWSKFSSELLRFSDCKFLLTTHNLNVASVTSSTTYRLQRMRDEDCKALIIDRSISHHSIPERQLVILEEIAGAIAQKCRGLPLAAHVLGLHLSSRLNEDDWIDLSERDICGLPLFREKIFPAFRLNNYEVVSHIKRCLAYCSLFPHNYDFKKEYLIQLWMAEGFILSQQEEVGSSYFEELLYRSIFMLSDFDNNGRPTYTMHEFIHRFAELVASQTCFRMKEGESSSSVPLSNKIRHLSFLHHTITMELLKAVEKCESLRTILLLGENGTKIGQIPYSLFHKLHRLRVLDMCDTDVEKLPESLGKLKHLRYLDLSKTPILKLPESTSNLYELQVLKLRECPKLLELPTKTKNLTNLHHLEVNTKKLRSMPASIGSLTSLQTLPIYIVGKREGIRITELKKLKLLRGTICIKGLGNIRHKAEAEEARLCEKPYIKRLQLAWNSLSNGSIAKDILSGLQPHNNLEELQVTNYGGLSFPDWITSPLCRLESIHLRNCAQCDVLPSLGDLPFLKAVHIEAMHNMKFMDPHFCGDNVNGGFPLLESLKIQGMNSLTMWYSLPDNSMQKLTDLTIESCPKLLLVQSLKHMRSLRSLEIICCPELLSLPELPESLQSLIIIGTDRVKQRCKPEGPDWGFIGAIPYVEIDFVDVSVSGSSN